MKKPFKWRIRRIIGTLSRFFKVEVTEYKAVLPFPDRYHKNIWGGKDNKVDVTNNRKVKT